MWRVECYLQINPRNKTSHFAQLMESLSARQVIDADVSV
jgi:hypothetical protein